LAEPVPLPELIARYLESHRATFRAKLCPPLTTLAGASLCAAEAELERMSAKTPGRIANLLGLPDPPYEFADSIME
jgi:hypothetical protein